jgi:predicted adenine nucleotide alpha hydrolase (AANH) superfamily ATPase
MKILLHICCAVCAGACVQRLRQEGYQISGYFYNPNIQPPGEYLMRLQEVEELAKRENFSLLIGDYDVDSWFSCIRGWEEEPEGGRRCIECFTLRLAATAKVAINADFSAFATTLTISPHKDAKVINTIGRNIDSRLYLVRDFKKHNGFKKAQQLSRQYSIYRQNYCGCLYSLR